MREREDCFLQAGLWRRLELSRGQWDEVRVHWLAIWKANSSVEREGKVMIYWQNMSRDSQVRQGQRTPLGQRAGQGYKMLYHLNCTCRTEKHQPMREGQMSVSASASSAEHLCPSMFFQHCVKQHIISLRHFPFNQIAHLGMKIIYREGNGIRKWHDPD